MNTRRMGLLQAGALATLVALLGCTDEENDPAGESGWSGTFSAMINGVAVSFNEGIWMEEINGGDAWVIANSGDRQLQFYVPNKAVGIFLTDGGAMGRYVPDTSDPDYDYANPTDAYESRPGIIGGSITLTEAGANSLGGSFAFDLLNAAGTDTVRVTNGSFAMEYGVSANPTTPVGASWQANETGVLEHSFHLADDGSMESVLALFELESCISFDGSYSITGDSLHLVEDGVTSSFAWSLSGEVLLLRDATNPAGFSYQRITALPECSDYGFGAASDWQGTLMARIDGQEVSFTDRIRVETIFGDDLWVIADAGDTQLQFYLESAEVRTHNTGDDAMGRYVPDTSLPGYDYANPAGAFESIPGVIGGGIVISELSESRIVGSFAFDLANAGQTEFTSVTHGQIDIHLGEPALDPAGVWQRTEGGLIEESWEFLSEGSYTRVTAYLDQEYCESENGSWSLDGDLLSLMPLSGGTRVYTLARSSSLLSLSAGGETMLFNEILSLPDCEHYGFDPFAAFYGSWQHGVAGDFEETYTFREDGRVDILVALFQDDYCFVVEGLWTATLAEITIEYLFNNGPPLFAWSRSGNTLTLDSPLYSPFVLERVETAPTCDDYDFVSGTPQGTWQQGVPGTWEFSVEYAADFGYSQTYAIFTDANCFEEAGSWNADSDSVYTNVDGNLNALAYERQGTLLTLTYSDGNRTNQFTIDPADMPACSDYGLGGAAAGGSSPHALRGGSGLFRVEGPRPLD